MEMSRSLRIVSPMIVTVNGEYDEDSWPEHDGIDPSVQTKSTFVINAGSNDESENEVDGEEL